ncbi:MAG: carboxypeptidase regulatory-like domain-containing protein [Marinifilaceae bacterium]
MNTKKRATSEMLIRLKDYRAQNSSLLIKYPLCNQIFSKLNEFEQNLNECYQEKQKTALSSYTSQWDKKENLASILSIVMGYLANHAIKTKQTVIPANLYNSEKKLIRSNSNNLISISKQTLTLCKKLGNRLPETGITNELLNLLTITHEQYQTIIHKQEINQTKKITITKEIEDIEKNTMDLVCNHLDPLMQKTFHKRNPSLYKKYRIARKIQGYAHRKTAIKGRVVNAISNRPINHVLIEIPKAHISHKTKGTQGGFRIRHLEPGNYEIRCSFPGFETTTLNIQYKWGETIYLHLKLQPSVKMIENEKMEIA